MSYAKKYGAGNVHIDMPYAQFIHQLPLLSFSDVQHTINVSLIFQSKESNNPFSIATGYKLNLQKRLIMNGNIPVKFEEGNGKIVTLNNCSNRFVFDDGSQRIIRSENSTFVLENPDYSKEVYDTSGKITEAWDKYGNKYLIYSYVNNKLDSVGYRNKTVKLNYNETSGRLESLQYICNNKTICTTTFVYSGGNVCVEHYCGVTYDICYSNGNFVICATSERSEEYTPHRLECTRSSASLIVKETIGDTVVDRTTYDFMCDSGENKFDVWDVTNYSGVKTRIQFKDGKPLYSYEARDDMFVENPETNNYNYFAGVTNHSAEQKNGAQEDAEVVQMHYNSNLNRFSYGFDSTKSVKHIVISGWLKKNSGYDFGADPINVWLHDSALDTGETFYFGNLPLDKWVYFSNTVQMSQVDSPMIGFGYNSAQLSARDFKITLYYENDTDSATEIKLIDNNVSVSLNSNTVFRNGSAIIDKNIYNITAKDIIRYKINQMYGTYKDEIYFNECRGVIPNAGDLKVECGASVVSVKDATIEKSYSLNGDTYLTKIMHEPYPTPNYNLVIKKLKNEYCYSETMYDVNYLDIWGSINDGVVTTYDRNQFGLITSQGSSGIGGPSLDLTNIRYDEDCTKVVSTTNEFGQMTQYTTDDIWGVVTEVELSDGTIIKDGYDDDMSTLVEKSFAKDSKEKVYRFAYPDEQYFRIRDDTFEYEYDTYWSDDGRQYIRKFGNLIETHKVSVADGTFEDSYPDYLDPEHEQTGTFDKYGRVTQIDGLLANTYGVSPIYVPGQGGNQGQYGFLNINNSNSQLAESRDLTTQKVKKYAYEKGRASRIGEFNNNGLLNEEIFAYDDIGRLVKDEYTYAGGNKVISEIAYKKNANHPLADNTVSTYTYKVNSTDTVAAQTENIHDPFKRITNKKVSLASSTKQINKQVSYNATRVTDVQESFGDENIGTTEYIYDNRGRITGTTYVSDTTASQETTYQYDEFGQLIREDNKALDKTFVYEYNNIGNVTLVKEYDYHTPDEALPRCQKCVKYEYDSEYPDKLTKFDGNEIEYNSIGCPSKYKDENYEWANGKLSRIHRSTFIRDDEHYTTRTFTYDGHGRRTQKYYISGVKFSGEDAVNSYSWSHTNDYTYDNSGRLIREVRTDRGFSGEVSTIRELVYLYDESGMIGVMYSVNGDTPQPYYYHRNLQGDVIAIYDANGEKQVEYAYDAWGNCDIIYRDTKALAETNPIRYRGYYYDTETKLYYLNARYYSPEWRRFISPDAAEYIDPETPNGLNLYAYCNNDPVNHKQYSLSEGSVIGASISAGGASVSTDTSFNGESVGVEKNTSLPSWVSTAVGAIPDFILGMRYLAASGMHSKFAYATNTRYMHPIMGGTWRWFGKSSSSFGTMAQGTFKQILTGDARAGFGAIAKSFGGVVGLNALVNFGFNLYENNWQVDSAMLVDTAIDTAIGVGSYYLAAGAMSLATAGLLAVGVTLPGVVVVGCVVILSVGFEDVIRAISGYWD